MPAIVSRLARSARDVVIVVVLVAVFTVLLVHLAPGSPAQSILGNRATQEQIDRLNAELGLNAPLWEQLIGTLGRFAVGDLGSSLVRPSETVAGLIGQALPITMSLVVLTILLSLVVGIPLGLLGESPRSWVTRAMSSFAVMVISVPPFVLSLILILVVAIGWGLAPAGGWAGSWPANIEYLVLPSIALSGLLMPQILRVVQQQAAEFRSHEFVEAAISRGLSPTRVTIRHILPNSLLPVITIIGYNAAALISGAVVAEAIFGIPGFGQVLVNAVSSRDYPVIEGLAVVTAVAVVIINLAADALCSVVDPRTRVSA